MADSADHAWIGEYITHCYPLLGLTGWQITTKLADHVDCKDLNTVGEAWLNPRYLLATITLQRAIQPNDDGYIDLTHELLHVALGRQDQMVRRILDLVPAEQRDHAAALWAEGDEPSTEILARALAPLLRAGLPGPALPAKKKGKKGAASG